jgi:Ca-activated chloride channel family protein
VAAGIVCLGIGLAFGGCHAKLQAQAEISIGSSGGGYAAMEEVAVEGGELRLATPVAVTLDDGSEQETIAFPLRHTAVNVDVAGMMGIYTVEQTFENPYPEPIEAVYVFPLGDEAAVSGYAITIGERTIAGEIDTRERARATYEQARDDGYTAAIVEQEKPNVFSQRIANIAPRETIKVRLTYVELLDRKDGAYELVFPMVVGPRYLPKDRVGRRPISSHAAGGAGRSDATSIPYADATVAGSTVSFTANIDAGMPITGLDSPSHDLDVTEVGPTRSKVTLVHADEVPNRDLVVRYTAAGDATMVGALAHRAKDAEEGYFVLTIEPKASYRTGDVSARELMILIDTSGSMDGAPLQQAKALAAQLLESATPRDTFNVIAFASGVDELSATPLAGTAENKQAALDFLAGLQAGNGTELEQGMIAGLETSPGADRIRMVYMLSDAYVGNDDVVLATVRGKLGHNRVFPVGIGSAPNRYLIDRLGVVGRGFASYLGLTEQASDLGPELVRRSAYPYLTDVSVDWGDLQVTDVTPLVMPDVYAGMPLVISGRYLRAGKGEVVVTATTGRKRVRIPVEVTFPEELEVEPVAHLWARRRIDGLMLDAGPAGPSTAAEQEITQLGLRFHLVTEFTSFVAVDRTRVIEGGRSRVVEQPALGPEGVNLDTAVGYEEPAYDPTAAQYRSSGGGGGGGGGGLRWGGGGGGDADPWTILLALALVPLAWRLRRARA